MAFASSYSSAKALQTAAVSFDARCRKSSFVSGVSRIPIYAPLEVGRLCISLVSGAVSSRRVDQVRCMAVVDQRVIPIPNLPIPADVLGYELVQGTLVEQASVTGKSIQDAPTAVLLHGILGSRKNWGTFAKRLAKEFPTWQEDKEHQQRKKRCIKATTRERKSQKELYCIRTDRIFLGLAFCKAVMLAGFVKLILIVAMVRPLVDHVVATSEASVHRISEEFSQSCHRQNQIDLKSEVDQINKDSSQLSELVGALEADKADTFVSVVKSIRNKHKLPPYAIIQGIQISGDTLIHTAARHKAKETLDLICQACPPLLTAQNWVGDTVWHVLAIDEGLNTLFRQLRVFRQELLSTPTTYKAGKNGQHLRLNSLNNEGNTALHASLIYCNESVADELFEMTPAHESQSYFLPNKEGKSAIYLAAEAGYVNLLRRMMNVAASYPGSLSETLKGKSIIHAAIAGKHLVSLDIIMELAPELFHSRDEKGMTPLQWAASSGEVFAYLKAKLGRTSPGSNYI
ncbi:hypothetical protein QQ045_021932 [Rhodiola kirilowii]